MRTFISFEEAQSLVLNSVSLLPVERRALANSSGHTLARSYQSVDRLPPFDNSAMDGFAVRLDDVRSVPAVLTISEEIAAGAMPLRALSHGSCARIMTGAPVPDGTDAIVQVEWTEEIPGDPDRIRILRVPRLHANIRRAGDDVEPGTEILPAGSVVSPAAIGVLAGQGFHELEVFRKPRVAVIATGDELVDVSEKPAAGQIRNTNGPALAAQVLSAGAIPVGPFVGRDNPVSLQEVFTLAMDADVWVISGGVSVGKYDFVKQELDRLGYRQRFWKVKQRPGKPLTFGYLENKPVFGLPGNPVSSSMCFEQYVRPLLYRMSGRTEVVAPRMIGKLAIEITKIRDLHYFTRGIASHVTGDGFKLSPSGGQGSHVYSAVLKANCIIHLPAGIENPPAGTEVEFEWLPWAVPV